MNGHHGHDRQGGVVFRRRRQPGEESGDQGITRPVCGESRQRKIERTGGGKRRDHIRQRIPRVMAVQAAEREYGGGTRGS